MTPCTKTYCTLHANARANWQGELPVMLTAATGQLSRGRPRHSIRLGQWQVEEMFVASLFIRRGWGNARRQVIVRAEDFLLIHLTMPVCGRSRPFVVHYVGGCEKGPSKCKKGLSQGSEESEPSCQVLSTVSSVFSNRRLTFAITNSRKFLLCLSSRQLRSAQLQHRLLRIRSPTSLEST
jgi:hypothetical protein